MNRENLSLNHFVRVWSTAFVRNHNWFNHSAQNRRDCVGGRCQASSTSYISSSKYGCAWRAVNYDVRRRC